MVFAPNFVLLPTTKHERDVVAFELACLFSFILIGLITAGML